MGKVLFWGSVAYIALITVLWKYAVAGSAAAQWAVIISFLLLVYMFIYLRVIQIRRGVKGSARSTGGVNTKTAAIAAAASAASVIRRS